MQEEGSEPREVTVQGLLRCLGPGGDLSLNTHQCEAEGGGFALLTPQGEMIRFDPTDQRAGIFRDRRVHDKTLRVHGQRSGEWLTIVHLHSIVDGVPHKIYYRCEVCNITAYAPGPCWCCQDDFEFRETPVNGDDGPSSQEPPSP